MSDDLATKTVNTFMEITTLGIKVIRPKSDDIELTNLWDDVDDYLSLLLDF